MTQVVQINNQLNNNIIKNENDFVILDNAKEIQKKMDNDKEYKISIFQKFPVLKTMIENINKKMNNKLNNISFDKIYELFKGKQYIPEDKKKLQYPKNDIDWNKLTNHIDTYLKEFVYAETPQKTIEKLKNELYELCKKHLSFQKKNHTAFIETKAKKRDNLVNEVIPSVKNVKNECSNEDISIHFQNLNSNYNHNHNNNKNEEENHKCDLYLNEPRNTKWEHFDNSNFTIEEFKHILDTKRNKNSNYDGLTFDLVLKCKSLQQKLLELYNQIYASGKLPTSWYYGFVYALHKGKGDNKDPKSYRSIVRMDTFSKLYWHLINTRIINHLDNNNIINNIVQKAYQREFRGVEENLFIHQQLKPKSKCIVYLDIKNAYGSVSPELLETVMKYYGIPDILSKSIIDYIENRKIYYGDIMKKWNYGLSQGLTLSNILFTLSLNYILDYIHNKYSRTFGLYVNNCNFLLQAFADDIVIFGDNIANTQIVLTHLCDMLNKAGLNIQINKCYVNYQEDNISLEEQLKINGKPIPNLNTNKNFKYLGQYVYYQNDEDKWKRFATDVKEKLTKMKNLFDQNLQNVCANDYWYAYQSIRFKINWFMRVNDCTPEKAAFIENVEKEFFNQIPKLKDRLGDNDYKVRRNKSIITRYSALNNSKDSRIVSLYKSSMGDRYKNANELYKNNTDTSLTSPSGFRRSFYV